MDRVVQVQSKIDSNLSFIQNVLHARHIDIEPDDFFGLTGECVQTPFALNNLQNGIDMLINHIKNNDTIHVLVDNDVDGFTSAATLINYIDCQVGNGDWSEYAPTVIPIFQNDKVHGISPRILQETLELHPDLLIVPDASGEDSAYQKLNDANIDVLVIDHHEMPNFGKDINHTVVINNQQSPAYINKQLSGVGMVYQFLRAVDSTATNQFADIFLDLVAAGLVSDVMSLSSPETRFLVYEGLKIINNPLLYKILSGGFNVNMSALSPTNIAFNLAPVINATNRVGDEDTKKLVFRGLLMRDSNTFVTTKKRGYEGESVPLIDEAVRVATNCKSRQSNRQKKLMEIIQQQIEANHLDEDPIIMLAIDEYDAAYPNLAGLAAGTLTDTYHRPIGILFYNKDIHQYRGSFRVPNTVPVFGDFRKQCADCGLFEYALGHSKAFGVAAKRENIDKIREVFRRKYNGMSLSENIEADFEFDWNDPALPNFVAEMSKYMKFFGKDIEAPTIWVKNIPLWGSSVRCMGSKGGTLKISKPNLEAITFKSSPEFFSSIFLEPTDDGLNQCYLGDFVTNQFCINEFGGINTPMMTFNNLNLGKILLEF